MMPSNGLFAQLACIWEATARKAGNVHRQHDFADLTYLDFLHSAAAIVPSFERAHDRRVGITILEAIKSTRQVCSTNTNLGIVLLFAPLAGVPVNVDLRHGLNCVLENLSLDDAKYAFEAIRMAQPGSLGKVSDQDVAEVPTVGLREAMSLAADRDLLARQYVTGFDIVFDDGVPVLHEALNRSGRLETAIVLCHLHLLARHGDSLIARKCGLDVARQAQGQARSVLLADFPYAQLGRAQFLDLDTWLRADGHRRNPGTTADLTAACLFVALRQGIIQLPLQFPWTGGF